ncbi:MAG: DUF3015 family protein [Bdellovibrionaceae bacterium]|nr:DUF3015 family protein [Pseudobdellovibrionaceae bacterium]
MKNLILAISTLFVVSTGFAAPAKKKAASSSAGYSREYGVAGCGLGAVVVGKRGGQIFAATTNGTSSNQLFGITFGTLNCTDGPTNEVASNMDKFIIANRSALSADVAKGDGETLSALTQVMGCNNVQSQEMGRVLKAKYNQIFANDAQPNIVTDSIITVIMNDTQVASRCNLG